MYPTWGSASLSIRVRQTNGSGFDWDFWHIDDVCFEQVYLPILEVSKVAITLSDPINGTSSPKSIPCAIVEYTITLVNLGIGAVDADSIVIEDPVPANTALFVDTGSGDPISFADGATSSGLSYIFAADVTFSNQVGGNNPSFEIIFQIRIE